MIPSWLIPTLSICLNIGSALVYCYHQDYNRTIYWMAAAVLTTTVTLRQ
jgi:hypothetical protein